MANGFHLRLDETWGSGQRIVGLPARIAGSRTIRFWRRISIRHHPTTKVLNSTGSRGIPNTAAASRSSKSRSRSRGSARSRDRRHVLFRYHKSQEVCPLCSIPLRVARVGPSQAFLSAALNVGLPLKVKRRRNLETSFNKLGLCFINQLLKIV